VREIIRDNKRDKERRRLGRGGERERKERGAQARIVHLYTFPHLHLANGAAQLIESQLVNLSI
jgi:hypothetical protein